MVFLEPHQLGWRPLTQSWLSEFPEGTLSQFHKEHLMALFDWIVPAALKLVRAISIHIQLDCMTATRL